MSQSEDLRFALNFLANEQLTTPQIRQTVQEEIRRMSLGTAAQQSAAKELHALVSYSGSEKALEMVGAFHSALRTNEGAKAAGLPRRRRGKSYTTKNVTKSDRISRVLLDRELGLATDQDVIDAARAHNGLDCDDRTIAKFIEDLKPLAVAEAHLIRLVMGQQIPKPD